MQPLQICIGREIQCLPYAGFFTGHTVFGTVLKLKYQEVSAN